jgi:hypothetical protein
MPATKSSSVKDPSKGWTRRAPYEYAHPGGTIANPMVSGKSRWVLSHAAAASLAASLYPNTQ